MPGPKMGPRPDDFDEDLVRKAPTFQKWVNLQLGQKLTYACRTFVKGGEEDEERLMRRIMIARRNNLKDHATVKMARAAEAIKRGVVPGQVVRLKKGNSSGDDSVKEEEVFEVPPPVNEMEAAALLPVCPPSPSNPSGTKRRRIAGTLQPTDDDILMEMDVPAVEATRSYRKWLALPEGTSFTYNQTYIKGKDDHDWLLKKNIWRRMRYRRENRVKVAEMKIEVCEGDSWPTWKAEMMPTITTAAANAAEAVVGATAKEEEDAFVSKAVVDAAAAAAAQVEAFEPGIDADAVASLWANDPIVSLALDSAAQLAAAAVADTPAAMGLEESVMGAPTAELVDIVVDNDDVEQVEVTIAV
ncbi:hypothetical protein ACHAXR_010958 [Thalassiosira sp. AJA248-18]